MRTPNLQEPLLVACLCAAWCGSCRDYRAIFDTVASGFPDARFIWIDIEDEADLVDPVDVENFPSVLIARGRHPSFFGPLLPHRDTLLRLVRTHAENQGGPVLHDPELQGLVNRLVKPE